MRHFIMQDGDQSAGEQPSVKSSANCLLGQNQPCHSCLLLVQMLCFINVQACRGFQQLPKVDCTAVGTLVGPGAADA